jgi:hypothetical protein
LRVGAVEIAETGETVNTFLVVTFAWSFALALLVLNRLFRCDHDWEPVVERELPAVVELLGKEELAKWRSSTLTFEAGLKKFFAVISCKKCGAVKEFTTMSGGSSTRV